MKLLLMFMLFGIAAGIYATENLVLADFGENLIAEPGWEWQGFSDRVMGGRSDIEHVRLIGTQEGTALQLSGRVVTRGGGFIQVRLLHEQGNFDASSYAGIEVEVLAPAGGSYYLFARTRDNRLPWSYYGAQLEVPETRSVLRIPWSAFLGQATLRNSIRPQMLSSIALVAAYDDFFADLHIFRVSLYHQ